jgi:D-3-phosphoglycerate dehydrogenase
VLDADLAGQDSAALLQQIRSLEGTVGARLVFEH